MILQYNWKSNYFKRFKEHSFGCLCENEEIKLKVLLDSAESCLFGWKGTLARLQLWENLIQFRIETLRQTLNTKAQGREGRKASPTSKSTTLLAEPFFCLLDFGLLSKEKDRRRLCSLTSDQKLVLLQKAMSGQMQSRVQFDASFESANALRLKLIFTTIRWRKF